MPIYRPPNHGFLGLLTGNDDFQYHVRGTATLALVRLGLFPCFDDKRLSETLILWRECYIRWTGPEEPPEKVSHIKMAGALLWAFLQNETLPIDDVVQLQREHFPVLKQFGADNRIVEFQKGKGEIFQASPNPSVAFIFVTAIFNTIQRARGMTRCGIDFDRPPLTKHYFQNLACWYLVDCDPTPDDLYMLYKTMDLYALEHPPFD